MAINTNTTQTMKKTSTVLAPFCENTKKNMKKLAAKLYGKATPKMETVSVPTWPGVKDDVITVQVNGVKFYLMRGDKVEVPAAVAEVLRNTGNLPKE